MSDIQDLIHKTSIDCIEKGKVMERERIIKLLTDEAGDSWPTGIAHLEISLPNLIELIKGGN